MQLAQFVVAFFTSKRLSLLTAFVCWDTGESNHFFGAARAGGVRTRVVRERIGAGGGFQPELYLAPDGAMREGVLLDTACSHARHILEFASSSRAFNHRHTWLLLHNGTFDPPTLHAVLSDVDILPDADVTWSAPDAMADVYRVKRGEPLVVTEWGVDRNVTADGLEAFWARQPTTVTRRKDLRNIRIKSTAIVTQPQHFKGWADLSARQIDTYPKFTYPLMMLLAQDLNFRHNMRQVDLYGEERNGSFDGLAGQLQRREVELGITSMFMRADRWRVLHFTAETIAVRGAFMFRQPVQAAVTNVFVLPFSRGVWAGCVALLAMAALVLAGLARAAGRFDPQLGRFSVGETLTFAVGTICQQGFHVTPSLASARLVMFSALLLALFSFTAYSAKIVAILQAPSDALRTIEDLERSSIGVAVQETTYKKVYFAESTDPATQRLYRKKLLPLGERAYMSVVDGIARMRTEFFAFQVEESPGYDIISKTFTEREKCGLKQIRAFELPMVSVPMVRHSGYRELVAVRLRWQRETGLLERTQRVWLARRPQCDARAGGFASVGVGDVLPIVQVLGMGALLSLLLLAAERRLHTLQCRHVCAKFWSKMKKKQNDKVKRVACDAIKPLPRCQTKLLARVTYLHCWSG